MCIRDSKATGGTWDPYVTYDELELYGDERNTFGQNLAVAKKAKRKSIRDARKSNEPNWFDRFEEDYNAKKAYKIWSDPQRRADWSKGGKYSRESSAPTWQRYFREFDEAVGKNAGGMIDLNDPTNRDTVPAMLTPGEFVLNKEATAMYGPLIEKMNNAGLKQRHQENQMVKANIGKKISKLHGPNTPVSYTHLTLPTILRV